MCGVTMRIINDLLTDSVYKRLLEEFKSGKFTFGKEYNTTIWSCDDDFIPLDDKALGRYIDALNSGKIHLYEVPDVIRTEEFYVNTFTNKEVNEFIKNNNYRFSREFYKSVIMQNRHSLKLDNNCFEIMPLEYIDEEIVSLAILNGIDEINHYWLMTVYRRNKDVISEDVWKLAARLYGSRFFKEILDITPEEYKDKEWYSELFKCTYNNMSRCDRRDKYYNSKDKTVLMDYVPKEVLTEEFLINLIKDNPKNIARFNEYALEKKIKLGDEEKKIWQHLIEEDGDLIELIDLNDERIDYFKSLYDKDSIEYIGFKYQLRDYQRKNNKKNKPKNSNYAHVIMDALLYAKDGDDVSLAIENEVNRNRKDMRKSNDLLPIKYQGEIPDEFRKEYDSFEYLEMMYKKYGIEIVEEEDYYLYKVKLPEGFKIEYDNLFGKVIDNDGDMIFCFFRDDKFYDRDAYVTYINDKILKDDNKKLIRSRG
jgi:hypothetical protein